MELAYERIGVSTSTIFRAAKKSLICLMRAARFCAVLHDMVGTDSEDMVFIVAGQDHKRFKILNPCGRCG
jgi:hypothetical protein